MPRKPKNAPVYDFMKYCRMFGDEHNASVRSVRFKEAVPCAHCQRKGKVHWTMIVPFRAVDFPEHVTFALDTKTGPLLAPLSPVCSKHLLAPDATVMGEMVYGMRRFFNLTAKRIQAERKEAAKKKKTP